MIEKSPQHILPTSTTTRQSQLRLDERLRLIGLIDEGMRQGSPRFPVMADLFNDLWELINATVSGARIDLKREMLQRCKSLISKS